VTKAGSGAWSKAITGQAASRTIRSIRPRGVRAEPDQRDVRSLPRGHGADVLDLDLARDHFVPERGDDRGDESEPILPLVGDQHAEVLSVAVAQLGASLTAGNAIY
jgi:hypothetical protein